MNISSKFVHFNGKEKPQTKSSFYEKVILKSAACSLPLEQFRERNIKSLDTAGSSEPNVSRLFNFLARSPSYTLADMSLVQVNGRMAGRDSYFQGAFFFFFSSYAFSKTCSFPLFLFFLAV